MYFDVMIENTTLDVPGDYPTIQEAIDSLYYTFIPPHITVTIKLAPGNYEITEPIRLPHNNAQQINIVAEPSIFLSLNNLRNVDTNFFDVTVPGSMDGLVAGAPFLLIASDHNWIGGRLISQVHGGNNLRLPKLFRTRDYTTTTSQGSVRGYRWETVITCNNCGAFNLTHGIGKISGIAFKGNSDSNGVYVAPGGRCVLEDVFIHGFGLAYAGNSSHIFARDVTLCGNGTGVVMSTGGSFNHAAGHLTVNGNRGNGIWFQGASVANVGLGEVPWCVSVGNGANGLFVDVQAIATIGRLSSHLNIRGALASGNGYIDVNGAEITWTGNTTDAQTSNKGAIIGGTRSRSVGTFAPANGTAGSNQAFINIT
jgi:hypothetical protein